MKIRLREIIKFAAFVLLGVVAFSCVPTKTLYVEIPEPSKKELPANIQSLTLVTQTVDDKYTDLESDSLQKIFYKQNFDLDTVIYDKQVVDTTLQALGELLFESGRYDYVIPEDRFLQPQKISFLNNELPWSTVRELCKTFNTDAVLSLDYLSTRVSTDFGRDSYYNPVGNGFYSAANAEMKVIYNALFRVYYPDQERILVRQVLRDTLVWEDADVSVRNLFQRFPPVKQALIESGITIALDLSDTIAVIWQPARRTYFTKGNDAFDKANKLVNDGKWKEAVSIWKKVAESTGSKGLKSKAQLNVAVGYEMTGDLENAIAWALKSYKTMYRQLTYDYLETLKDRKNELKKLKK